MLREITLSENLISIQSQDFELTERKQQSKTMKRELEKYLVENKENIAPEVQKRENKTKVVPSNA